MARSRLNRLWHRLLGDEPDRCDAYFGTEATLRRCLLTRNHKGRVHELIRRPPPEPFVEVD